jgi:hypothetical protein
VTAKALDFALAVVGHELGTVERQQAIGRGFRKTAGTSSVRKPTPGFSQ